MSLDVYLTGPETEVECVCSCCDNVHTKKTRETYYDANITHNLGRMADAAGIYNCMWRPEEHGIAKAAQLIEPLRAGLALLQSDEPRFSQYNASNGWGLYEHFVPFVAKYLQACQKYPDADVNASR